MVPRRILMVLDREFPPDLRVENEMESLLKKGFKIDLACYTRMDRPAEDRWQQARVFRKPISPFIYKSSVGALKFPFYFNFWRTFLDELCNKNSYDAVHVHDLPLARVGYEMKKRYGMPLVLDLHENWPALLDIAEHTQGLAGRLLSSGRQWRAYEKEYCQKADHIIVVVEEARDRLAGLGIDHKKISIVSNLLNIIHLDHSAGEPEEEAFVMFYGGGLNRHRGLQQIIAAMPEIVKTYPGVKLWIVGEGSFRETLEKQVKKLGMYNHVIFHGWKPYPSMMLMLSKSHVALIPHIRSEHTNSTIPHKLFQYMYLGKPVIASNCSPIKRILEETGSGLIYNEDKPQEVANLVKVLAGNRDYRKQMAEKGRKTVLQKYIWSLNEPVLECIYETIKKETL